MSVELAGATYVPVGIASQPTYAYAPPATFFEAAAPAAGPGVFDIRDFGAVADAGIDSRAMIQAAIDAAHAAGGGLVYVPPGTWGIGAALEGAGSLQIDDNVFLKGAGMGQSILRLMDGTDGVVTGMVRSVPGAVVENWGVADLTLDGNRANTTAQVDGFYTGPKPGLTDADADVTVLRLEVHDVSRYGVDPHEQTIRLSIRDSVSHHNGFDGFTIDFVSQSELVGNLAYENGRHGFNFVTTSHDILVENNIARDNGANGFVVQRGSEDIAPAHDIAFVGGQSTGNGGDGVLVHLSTGISVTGMEISGNGQSGVRLLGASNATISGNTIHDNSQALANATSEILLAGYFDEVSGATFQATDNLVSDNVIACISDIPSRYGLEERDGEVAGNQYAGNLVSGPTRGAMLLFGADGQSQRIGTDGADEMLGSAAIDRITGLGGDDVIRAGASADRLEGGDGADTLAGNSGDDRLHGNLGNDSVIGGDGNDGLIGGNGDDTLLGNRGNDRLFGCVGNDIVRGEAGNDTVSGGAGNDVLGGGSGEDWLIADAGNDAIAGGEDFDTLDFSKIAGPVVVNLSAGTATGAGNDTIVGIEAVIGTKGADGLTGASRAEHLVGGDGDDVLAGLAGADTLSGGTGLDRFVWQSPTEVAVDGITRGMDRIVDFEAGDILDLRGLTTNQVWQQVDDIVRIGETEAGTVVSALVGGTFQDVVLIDGIFGQSAALMVETGAIVLA